MTGREKLAELAAERGLSLKTAKRYLKAGVDLSDPEAVEEHQLRIRSRTGVSKNRKTASVGATLNHRRSPDCLS
jgi:hypothetical protein